MLRWRSLGRSACRPTRCGSNEWIHDDECRDHRRGELAAKRKAAVAHCLSRESPKVAPGVCEKVLADTGGQGYVAGKRHATRRMT